MIRHHYFIRRPIFLFTIAIFCSIICACSSDIAEDNSTGDISGSVSDRTTGEPVATANIRLSPGGLSTVTGSDGSFSFVDLAPGEYTLDIRKESYTPATGHVTVTGGQTAQTHLLIDRVPASITADRDLLDFGENTSDNTRSFAIVNSSYTDLSWQIDYDCSWIKEIRPASGILGSGKTETISIIIDREKLTLRDNETTIVVRSTNGRAEVKIKVTGPSTPIINIFDAIDISTTGATLSGTIVNPGYPAYFERGFIYNTVPMPTLDESQHIEKLTVPVTSEAEYYYRLNGLTFGQTYYVRAYAINSSGIFYSPNQIQVVPSESLPRVATLEPTDIDFSAGAATLWGEILYEGDPNYTERGFVFGTKPDPTINDNKITGNGNTNGRFSIYTTGLPQNTIFYVRAYACNKLGTAYGDSFKIEQAALIELPTAGIAVQISDIGYGDWNSVNMMCENSILSGYTDWRLPTIDELMILYNERKQIGGFKGNNDYWSSTIHMYDTYYYYYYINFSMGHINSSYKYNQKYVRCVRTLNIQNN